MSPIYLRCKHKQFSYEVSEKFGRYYVKLSCFLSLNFTIFLVQEDGQIGEIEDVTIHPLYQYARAYNDLAVIKLKASKGNQNFYIKRFFSNT